MRLVAFALSVLMFFLAGTVPAVAADYTGYGEPGYVWPPRDWSASLSYWDMYPDSMKREMVRDYNLAQAIRLETLNGGKAIGGEYRSTGYTRTPALDAAVSESLESVTIGQLSTATGRTTTQVSAAVAQQTARIKATGFPAWAKKNGLALGEAVLPSLIANAAVWYVDAQTAPYVHADGSECHWFGQCPGDETHYMNPELGDRLEWLWPATEWSIAGADGVVYEFVDAFAVPVGSDVQTNDMNVRDTGQIVNFGHPAYPTWGETEAALAGIVSRTAYAAEGQPIVPLLQQSTFANGPITVHRGWFDRTTGVSTAVSNVLAFDAADPYSLSNGPTVWSYDAARTAASLARYESLIDAAVGRGDAVEVAADEVTGTVAAMGPPAPNVPFVAAVTGLDSTGSFDPDMTIGEAAENVTIPDPADVPAPVHDATDTTPEQQEQVQPVDAPFVSGWLAEVLNPILQPVYSLFDGLDIFWPFRFMAARG